MVGCEVLNLRGLHVRCWAALAASVGSLGPFLGALWTILGRFPCLCGRSAHVGGLSALGAYVGGLGPLLGPLCAILGRSWSSCWRSWAALGAYVGGPGLSWDEKWCKPKVLQADLGREVALAQAAFLGRRRKSIVFGIPQARTYLF